MARLSGMPSEHHHEGPGDAPRRKRGRPHKNQSSSQASQEVASSSKRPASPTEPTHVKRTKRAQVTDEEQILEEIEQSTTRSQEGDTIHVETQSSSQVIRRPNRRHSEPPVAAQDDEGEDELVALTPYGSTQPAPGLTPHLNRIGAVRRDLGNVRRARMSMPAQLHLERVDEELDGTQFQYAPLTAVLDGRTRRRLRRSHLSQEVIDIEDNQKKDKKLLLELRKQLRAQDDKIKDLEYSLEARRLGEIDITDDHAEELEQELELAREEIDRLRASSLYNGSDRELSTFDGAADSDDEDDRLLLVDPEELKFSRDMDFEYIPDGEYATRVQELSSQMTFESMPKISQLTHDTLMDADNDVTILEETIQDKAVERYERELQHYIHRLAESSGAFRVLAIELQNLNYLDPGHSSNDIIVELRHGFDTLRAEVEKYFPGTTDGLTNQELLRKIPELFSGIFFELREKISISTASQKTEVLLRRQYEGVLDLLADSEDRVTELEQKEYSLDKSNEDKQRTIVDLEEQVTTLTNLANGQDNDLEDRDTQITGLRKENEEKDTTMQRLREALEGYRRDLDSVTKTSTEFEIAHHETIARMEEEHAEMMQGVQNELTAEQEAREAAESDAIQKGEVIDELEGRIESMESEVVIITDELAELRKRLAEQTESREAAEGQRDEQADLAYEYANTIETLNQTIADLRDELDEAKVNLDAERAQREKTEADLDDTNEKLEAANDRLHTMGVQANELRSKLFELQQSKEATIQQLEEEATARENDLNDQLNAEVEQRQIAEATIITLNQEIEALQANLATTQTDYDNMSEARQQLEEDRESQAAALNQQLADLRAKYTALENSTNSTITSLQANITDLNNQVQQQQVEINRLRDEITDKDERYDVDTAALFEKIEDLRGELATERGENERNRKEITSLSDRVENEANELLNMMNAHSEEVAALKTVIATHESTIANVQATAADREAEHEEMITERTTEIEEMRITSTARLETIVLLEASLEKLKAQFAAQEQDTRQTIDALNLAHRRLIEENEKLADAAKARFEKTLQHVQKMKVERVELKTQGVQMSQIQPGKITKTSEKVKVSKKGGKKKVATRGWRDSGIFGGEEDDTVVGAGKVNGEEVEEDMFA